LPGQGLRCTSLQGSFRDNADWTARFTFIGIDKERAKVMATLWLTKEFDGKDFSFFRKPTEPTFIFYVKFTRRDL